MFGLSKKDPHTDKLQVQVHVVSSFEAYRMAVKLWNENLRTLHLDQHAGKEFLRFAYTSPSCTVWLQRDQGRADNFELVVRWEGDKTHEVFVLNTGNKPEGNDTRVKALLNSMLTTPSVVLSNQQ
jgi:hypothetical protein